MALYSLYCADVPLRTCSLTHLVLSCIISEILQLFCAYDPTPISS